MVIQLPLLHFNTSQSEHKTIQNPTNELQQKVQQLNLGTYKAYTQRALLGDMHSTCVGNANRRGSVCWSELHASGEEEKEEQEQEEEEEG